MRKNQAPSTSLHSSHHVVLSHTSKPILLLGSYLSSPFIIEDANEAELSSVDTVPKGSKNDQIESDKREVNLH